MDNNYRVPLAAILRKAHGCIYRGTDEFIDVGGEVSELRRICDSQRATISRLREYAFHKTSCSRRVWDMSIKCDCGYDELIKEIGNG